MLEFIKKEISNMKFSESESELESELESDLESELKLL